VTRHAAARPAPLLRYFLSPARSIALSDPTALRSSNFWILPVEVFGSSPKHDLRHLEAGEQLAAMREDFVLGRAHPLRSSTNAHGTSPHFGSGIATTAAPARPDGGTARPRPRCSRCSRRPK
jgi:hypothetical protein